jgi:hypothetical protein
MPNISGSNVEAVISEIKATRANRAPTTADELRAWRGEGRRFEAHQQSAAVTASDRAHDDQAFIDSVSVERK